MRLSEALISFLLLLTLPVSAQTESADFSKGLQRLAELGLPEMKDAEWVKLSGNPASAFINSHQFRELGINLSGNAWKLNTDPPAYLEFGSSNQLEGKESDDKPKQDEDTGPNLFQKMLKTYKEENPEPEAKPETTAPAESKAAKDAKRIAEKLGEASKAESLNNSMRWGNSNLHGRLLLFAAQLHASGDEENANLLAASLFQAANDDSALINGAISHLADTRYDIAAEEFFESTDWVKYQAALESLLEKFPRGWDNAPAVALLVSNLDKRPSEPPTPSLPGIELNPEAIALLDKLFEKQTTSSSDEELAAARGYRLSDFPAEQRAQIIAMLRAEGAGISFSNQQPWLLPAPQADEQKVSSPIELVKRMGMDGLIALAAVATDNSLLPIPNPANRQSHYSSNRSSGEEIRQRYANLNRPISRGEVAVGLLAAVLPSGNQNYNRSSEVDPEEISQAATDFWKKNKDKSPVELAILYITDGNQNQQAYASNFLAPNEDPAAHAAFEKTVLSSAEPLDMIGFVEQYLDSRKAAAKPFANAYIKLLRENPPDEERLQRSRVGWQITNSGGLDNYLKKLSLKVGDVSLAKMLNEALKKNPDSQESGEEVSPVMALASAIQEIPLTECLETFGKAAGLASRDQWMEIHQLLLQRVYHELRDYRGEEAPEFEPLPSEVMELWKPLIARTEALPEDGEFPFYARSFGGKTVGDASTLILELAASPHLAYTLNAYAQINRDSASVMTFVRKRVADWSSGEEPEPWPDAGNVSEERSKEITDKLTTLEADEVIPYADSLTPDEKFALMNITPSFREPNPVPPGVLELRNTIVSLKPVFDMDHDTDAAAKLGIKVGDKITGELLTRISDDLLKNAAESSTTMVLFFPAPMNLGSNLYVTTNRDLDLRKLRASNMQYMPSLFEQHENPDALSAIIIGGSSDIRVIKDGKPVTLESDRSALGSLAEYMEKKSAFVPTITISTLTREDAEKISNQEEE